RVLPALSTSARSPARRRGLAGTSRALSGRAARRLPPLADRVEAEGEAAGEEQLALLRQRVELHAVGVAQQPLEAELAVEAGAAGDLQRLFGGGHDGLGGEGLAHQDLAGELGRRRELEAVGEAD